MPRPRPIWPALALSLLVAATATRGAPYRGEEFTYHQPDGTTFTVRLYGDEFYAVEETPDGFTITRDLTTGYFHYATLAADGLSFQPAGPGESRVGQANPLALGLTRHLRLPAAERTKRHREGRSRAAVDDRGRPAPPASDAPDPGFTITAPPSTPTLGSRIGLVLLIRFPDRPQDVTISQAQVDAFCNEPGTALFGNRGSVFDYFLRQSQGQLRYTSIVTAYYTARYDKSYYDNPSSPIAGLAQQLITEALNYLRDTAGFDFSLCDGNGDKWIDGINVFYAGSCSSPWSYGLWPHASAISFTPGDGMNSGSQRYQMTDMGSSLKFGTYCHENGHMICRFPDFYDYGYESYGAGTYSLMAYYGSQTAPVNVDAYLKYKAGWCDVTTFTSTTVGRASVHVDRNWFYRYVNPLKSQEYFLIETRQKLGHESFTSLPDQGLLIWHVDETGSNNNEQRTPAQHYEASIEQADNLFHLETDVNAGGANDLFHDGHSNRFDDTTSPDARWWSGSNSLLRVRAISGLATPMTFLLGSNDFSAAAPGVGVDAVTLRARCDAGATASAETFRVWNTGGGTLAYTATVAATWLTVAPTAGTATVESDPLVLTFASAGLPAGLHTTHVAVAAGGASNSPLHFAVQLTVDPAGGLAFGSTGLLCHGVAGVASTSTTFTLRNVGGGLLRYSNRTDQAWLAVAPTNGTLMTEADTILLHFHSAALAVGVYTARVTVTAPAATNSPQVLPVVFSVAAGFPLVVHSDYRFCEPVAGTNYFQAGLTTTCRVTLSPYSWTTTQQVQTVVSTGWVGFGSAPALGATTSTGPFTLNGPSTVQWNWVTTTLTVSNRSVGVVTNLYARDGLTALNRYSLTSGARVGLQVRTGGYIRLRPGFEARTGSVLRTSFQP